MAEDPKEKSVLKIDDSIEVNEVSLGARLNPGIHENVELREIKYVTPEDENASWTEACDFLFVTTGTTYKKDSQGNIERDAAAQPIILSKAGESVNARQFFDPDDVTKQGNTLVRIKHIITKFFDDPKEVRIEAPDNKFSTLVKNVIKLVGEKYKGKKLRLKVIADNKGYGVVPLYTPFVERMTATSSLNINKKELQGRGPASAAGLSNELSIGGDAEIPAI